MTCFNFCIYICVCFVKLISQVCKAKHRFCCSGGSEDGHKFKRCYNLAAEAKKKSQDTSNRDHHHQDRDETEQDMGQEQETPPSNHDETHHVEQDQPANGHGASPPRVESDG